MCSVIFPVKSPSNPVNDAPEKVFIVGLPKTGLTTLRKTLELAGLHPKGPNKKVLYDVWARDYASLRHYVEDGGTAFVDWPMPVVYQYLWRMYGRKALYILTVRASEDDWFRSLKSHAESYHVRNKAMRTFFGYQYPHGREAEHKDLYRRYNENVRTFFTNVKAGERFMMHRTGNPEDTARLADMFGLDHDTVMGIHENTSDVRRERYPLRRLYNRTMAGLYSGIVTAARSR